MNKIIIGELLSKRISVYVGGEFERCTNFLGLITLLYDYADFRRYTNKEQQKWLLNFLKEKAGYVDAIIEVRIK